MHENQRSRNYTSQREISQTAGGTEPRDLRNDSGPEFEAILMEEEAAAKKGDGGNVSVSMIQGGGGQMCRGDCLNLIAPTPRGPKG